MKKTVIIFFVLLFSAGVTFGQFSFGLKVGYNASKLHTTMDSIKSSFNSGLHFGAFFRFGNKVYVQPEAYYTLQGGIFKNSSTNSSASWKQRITVGTLDIPVLVGFKIIDLKVVNWRILAGPMVSFVINSKVSDLTESKLVGPVQKADISKLNWYVQAGTGVDVLFLTLDVRYQLGLNQMIKSSNGSGISYNLNATNNMWVVSLGFKI